MVHPKLAVRPPTALYLDLDGVVQHQAVMWHHRRGIYMSPTEAPGRTLFEWLPFLVEALAPFPDVRLVLSSSWCIRPGYGNTLKRLPAELRTRFIGGTFHRRVHGPDYSAILEFQAQPRWQQVLQDVERRKPRQWLAIDDDVEGWPAWALDRLIQCDGETGLSSPSVRDELQEKLKRCSDALLTASGEA